MLITINLLPNEIKQRHKQAKQNARVFTICFVILAVSIAITIVLFSYLTNIRLEQQTTQEQITASEKQLDKYQDTKQKAQLITERIKNIDDLESKSTDWQSVLELISSQVPRKVRIVSLEASTSPQIKLTISANAPTRREALKFYQKLKENKAFPQASLQSLAKTETSAVDFSISTNVDMEAVR